jgi:hypothetical protein
MLTIPNIEVFQPFAVVFSAQLPKTTVAIILQYTDMGRFVFELPIRNFEAGLCNERRRAGGRRRFREIIIIIATAIGRFVRVASAYSLGGAFIFPCVSLT